ncbi:MAG: cold shock and DUF1294 domain-containing protein [Candidatus Thiodiazotropha sp.]|jgi:uncharacterized membrane protein YsdA (DUF1294 family)/cold shock CspA family protein
MRTKGKITSWNAEKGFGFISPMAGGKRIFIHIKAFTNHNRRPEVGQKVTYKLSSDKQGRPRAIKASLICDRLPGRKKRSYGFLSIAIAVLFLIIVATSVFLARIPLPILALYMAASLLTFIIYALDKSAAKSGKWRTQERTLHLLSLAGGWPGALVAQQKLRHKTKKQSFRSVFWITVFLNCGAFVWLFIPNGATTLESLIEVIPLTTMPTPHAFFAFR